MRSRDPLADPAPLIRRVYAYVAYRIGAGADAEDVTSAVLERALRYRTSYDPARGEPLPWMIGIARTCVDDHLRSRPVPTRETSEEAAPVELEEDAVLRLSVADAVARLDPRDRELVALRYGADLSAREIGRLLEMKTNAVEVALHRTRERLRSELRRVGYGSTSSSIALGGPATEPPV